jgi:hypothetical protein
MVMKRVSVVLLAATLAAISVVAALVLIPQNAQAALATVKTCNGGTIQLSANENHMLQRHNQERELYPGVVEAIETLHDEGVRVHFITHNRNPDVMRHHLAYWLRSVLTVPFGLSVTKTGSKIPLLAKAGAFGMIDDKPSMLEEVAGAGLFAATIYQLWNRKLVESRPDIHGFEHWSEVPDLVLGALSKPAA